MFRRGPLALGLLLAIGCASPSTEPPPASPEPPPTTRQWRHKRTRLVVALGPPRHSANDVVGRSGQPHQARAKFSYGKVSKDLQDEEVSLWLRAPGDEWIRVGAALTNSDGWATIEIPARLATEALGTGHRGELLFVAEGDHTRVSSDLWLFEPGTRAVVFDVDGTLTTGDAELIKESVLGADIGMRSHADVVARRWSDAEIQPIYLTGRPYLFSPTTRAWLARHGFPDGPLITTDHIEDSLPGESRVGSFKSEWLRRLAGDLGLDLVAAYGNATTDVCAFAEAGIPPSRTFVLGRTGEIACGDHPPASGLVEFGPHRDLAIP